MKCFLVLLAFSLVPLLGMTVSSRRSIIGLGEDLSQEAQTRQSAALGRNLTRDARIAAAAIGQNVASLQMALHYLAASTAYAVARPEAAPREPIYTPKDFARPETAPPDLQMSWRYARVTGGGTWMPSAISSRYPVFVKPPGEDETLAPQFRGLVGLTPVFETIYRGGLDIVHRVYVGLENGLHISFPGHGHFAPEFDPRRRPWYVQAQNNGELTWLSHADSSTGRHVFTVTLPIREASGRFIGAAAIDLLPGEFMSMDELRSQWSADTLALLVLPESETPEAPPKLRIIGRGGLQDETGEAPEKETYLTFADPSHLETLRVALAHQESGTLELPYGGTPSIWAFARFAPPVDESLRMILIVPRKVVSSLSQQVARIVLDETHAIYRVTGIIAVMLIGLVLLVAWVGTRTVLRPLYVMVDAWERLSTGDFRVRIDERTGDERDILIQAFNDIVPRMEAHWNLNRSLETARQIQRNLMPAQDPELPGLDVAGNIAYCEQTGGDYYDVFRGGPPGEDRVAVVVGDVSGHGVASALLMTTARAMIRSMSVLEADVARRVTLVNRLLFPDIAGSGDFITLFYLECDLARRRFSWVRAGHDPALRYDPHTDRFTELGGEGMALGIAADHEYRASAAAMGDAGQVIIIGTDGIWESRDPEGRMFGKERLRGVIRERHQAPARLIRDAVFEAVAAFSGQKQDDDITLVVMKLGEPSG